ncbi:MAG: sterol desaturase family protein [Pseudomonadota bacterium]
MNSETVAQLAESFENGFYLIGIVMLLIEIGTQLLSGSFKGRKLLDIIASFSTQIPTVLAETFLLSFVYTGYVLLDETLIGWTMPINVWTFALTLLAADFIYYWEHRIAHEVRLFWTQHAVHHSSRHMNVAVAIRFGPLEGVISAILHLPLIVIGFPAELVFASIIIVLAYQVWIHTEMIGKMPLLDGFLNTPANHRVHHGCDAKYIDKNYGGILIIWDRIFDTYQAEEETPRYGLKRDFDSVNPLVIWFSEWPQLLRDLAGARSLHNVWMHLFGPPGWTPDKRKTPAKRNPA